MRDNFISTIVNFDTDDVTEDVRLKMRKYLENPDYNFEKVSYAVSMQSKLTYLPLIKSNPFKFSTACLC